MSVRRGVCAALLALLGGCAQTLERQAERDQQSAEQIYQAKVHTELAAAWYSRRKFDVALEETGIALQAWRDYVPAHNMRGLIYMEIGEDVAAQQAFARALELKPGDAETSNNYGWFLCSRNRAAESIAHFRMALEDRLYASPDKPLVNAGICTRKLGNNAKAESYFRQALSLQPEQPQANYHVADLAYRRGDFKSAKTHLDKALALSNASAEMLWLKVRLERKLGDRGAEASSALQLRRRFPQARETQLLMRGVYD